MAGSYSFSLFIFFNKLSHETLGLDRNITSRQRYTENCF